ncbi:MAG: BlaI/MecI/CopY family transcriptional regulator [Clostridiales bacterium]|nr:BlaI/MecI/CopY family transcriptional regulator [Clostridiales bacterium]
MINTHLTAKEYELMQILWGADKPLLISEINKNTKTISENSLHHILNSLMDKGFVKVVGSVKIVKGPSRLYAPAVTVTEYAVAKTKDIFKTNNKKFDLSSFVLCLMKKDRSGSVLNELKDIIESCDTADDSGDD